MVKKWNVTIPKLSGDKPRSQASEGSAYLVAAGRKPLSDHGNDTARNAGQRGRQLNVIRRFIIQPAAFLWFILPGNPEQVQRIHIPESHTGQPVTDFFRNGFRVLHLGNSGNDDAVFFCCFSGGFERGSVQNNKLPAMPVGLRGFSFKQNKNLLCYNSDGSPPTL